LNDWAERPSARPSRSTWGGIWRCQIVALDPQFGSRRATICRAARLTPLLEFLKADALVAMSPSGLSLNATVAYSARRLELGCLFYRRDRTECDGTCPATRAKRVAWGKAISERERRSKRKLFRRSSLLIIEIFSFALWNQYRWRWRALSNEEESARTFRCGPARRTS
jgi:hypothetical protein